jgi:hypothetical protein
LSLKESVGQLWVLQQHVTCLIGVVLNAKLHKKYILFSLFTLNATHRAVQMFDKGTLASTL